MYFSPCHRVYTRESALNQSLITF